MDIGFPGSISERLRYKTKQTKQVKDYLLLQLLYPNTATGLIKTSLPRRVLRFIEKFKSQKYR